MSLEKYKIREQTTMDGTQTVLSWVMPDNSSIDAILRIQARNTANNTTFTFKREYELTKGTGNITITIMNDLSETLDPFVTASASLVNNAGTLEISITGEASTTLNWKGTLTLYINK